MDHIFEPSEWFHERGLLQGHFREPCTFPAGPTLRATDQPRGHATTVGTVLFDPFDPSDPSDPSARCRALCAAFLRNPRVPEAVKQSSMQLTLKGKAEPSWEEKSEVFNMQEGSTFDQVKAQLDRLKDQGVEKRVIEVR